MIVCVSTNQRVVVAGAHDVLEGAEGVEAREQRNGQPLAGRVEPQRRRPRQDADAVAAARPGSQFVHALDVVPHPVAVDEAAAGLLGDRQHATVDVRGHSAEHVLRRSPRRAGQFLRTRSWLPPMPPLVTIDRLRANGEVADHVAELGSPRATHCSGQALSPRTPSTTPPVVVSSSTRWRKRIVTRPRSAAS